MKDQQQIHDLDTLEREIYRNELLAKDHARALEDDLCKLRNNFFDMAKNSMNRKKKEKGNSFTERLFRSEHIRDAIDNITDRITDQAADAINRLVSKLFKRHK